MQIGSGGVGGNGGGHGDGRPGHPQLSSKTQQQHQQQLRGCSERYASRLLANLNSMRNRGGFARLFLLHICHVKSVMRTHGIALHFFSYFSRVQKDSRGTRKDIFSNNLLLLSDAKISAQLVQYVKSWVYFYQGP